MIFGNVLFPFPPEILFSDTSQFPEEEVFTNNWKEEIYWNFSKAMFNYQWFLNSLHCQGLEGPTFHKVLPDKRSEMGLKTQSVLNTYRTHTGYSLTKVIIHPIWNGGFFLSRVCMKLGSQVLSQPIMFKPTKTVMLCSKVLSHAPFVFWFFLY